MEVGCRTPKAKLEVARMGSVELIVKEKEKVITVLAVVAELRRGRRSNDEIGGLKRAATECWRVGNPTGRGVRYTMRHSQLAQIMHLGQL